LSGESLRENTHRLKCPLSGSGERIQDTLLKKKTNGGER